jgi:phosphoglucosamine mutase
LANRLFGTDGIRGVAGEFPLDRFTVERIGRSLTENLASEIGRMPRIVVGRDTRESGPMIESALARGAIEAGAHLESSGVITTPGVAFLARTIPFDAGVVISASHNPFHDNGIKVFSPSGKKIPDALERKIEEDLGQPAASEKEEESRSISPLGPEPSQAHFDAGYIDKYLRFLANDVGKGLRLEGLRLGLDCANGASYKIAPSVFSELGADVFVIHAGPDGRNINEGCGSLHPDPLRRLIEENSLDLGVAFDGDADRALFLDAEGGMVDGDHTLLILAQRMKESRALKSNLVVTTVMSNLGLEIALSALGIEMVRTSVGDRFVLEELMARGAELGGEQSGHIILPRISLAGDGIITAIELIRAIRDSGKTLKQLASGLVKYPQVLINFKVCGKPALETLPSVQAEMRRIEDEMGASGRLLVRYSGTENVARVMIEGENQSKIQEYAQSLVQAIQHEIG